MLSEGLELEIILKGITPTNYPTRELIEATPYTSIMNVLDYAKLSKPEHKELISEIEHYISYMDENKTIQQLKQDNFNFEVLCSDLKKLI